MVWSSLTCPAMCFHPLSVSARCSCTCMMNLSGKSLSRKWALPSMIIFLATLCPWFCCCCTYQKGSTGGERRECVGGWARPLGSSVYFHGCKMTHETRHYIVIGQEVRLCHALKQVAQDHVQIFKNWLDMVLGNLGLADPDWTEHLN